MRKSYRVKTEQDFQKVFQAGNSFANRKFVVYVLPKEQSHFRVGLSVGKKVGNAVKRNEVKRKIRASLTEMKPRIEPAIDFIVIARPSIAICSSLVVVLSACGATGEVNAQSTGLWDRYIVYYFAEAIKALSFGNAGIGIILFTLIIRVILMPLMHFQTKSMRKTQELQPKLSLCRLSTIIGTNADFDGLVAIDLTGSCSARRKILMAAAG